MEKNNIVANASDGYGYKYAALSDIANQGFNIPKMKTGTENGKEYVFYYDADIREWIRGAEIVVPENIMNQNGKPKMNKAQLYGSALTYARRYTVLMADSLACDDDKNLENTGSEIFDEPIPQGNLKQLGDEFRKLYSTEEQARILNGLHLLKAEEIGIQDLQKYINFKKYGKN